MNETSVPLGLQMGFRLMDPLEVMPRCAQRGITSNGSINLKPIWSPSGTEVSFTSYREGNPDLYVADLKQGKIRRLSNRMGINVGGVWSPDRTKMALTLA